MHRFKKILFVTGGKDGGTAALRRAIALAKQNQAELTGIDVIRSVPEDLRSVSTAQGPIDLQALAVERRKTQLEEFLEPARQEGISTSATVLSGTPFLEIVREVLRGGHDLVMKTAEEPGGFRQTLFGSTGRHLMRQCPCPVWIVKADGAEHYGRILAAVDPSFQDEPHNQLDLKILQLASSLAEHDGSQLHVVHAWELYGEQLLRGRAGMYQADIDRLVQKTETERRQSLRRLLSEADVSLEQSRLHLAQGEPAEAIIHVTQSIRPDLLVMGTVSRTGIPGFVIGNTAEQVLNQVHCSVLTVKPDGFVSPIRLQDE